MSLTDSLTMCCLVNLIDMTLGVKMPTQKLRLLLLLMLMLRNVSAIVWCRFGSWILVIRSNFCPDFEHRVWSRFWSWSSGKIWSWSLVSFFCWCFVEVMLYQSWTLVEILELGLVKILKFKFSPDADIWLRFCCLRLVEILKMKFDQDLHKNYSTLGAVVPSAMFLLNIIID